MLIGLECIFECFGDGFWTSFGWMLDISGHVGDIFWTCVRVHFLARLGHVLGMFGHVCDMFSDMFWTRVGHVLSMFWTSYGKYFSHILANMLS